MKFVVFDTESDGFAYEATKLHVFGWTEDGETIHTTNSYDRMREVISQADYLVGHNVIRHDLPLLNRILAINLDYKMFVDTLALSWYLQFDQREHNLESIGKRYGVVKPKVTDWSDQPYEVYQDRVTEDVRINWKLWKDLERKLGVLYGTEQ